MYSAITVIQILGCKGHDVGSRGPDVSVLTTLRFMAEKNIGVLMVV
ncbi:MAG: hypothetical protein PVG32_17850 [Anaerolineales bacterium]|jgi:hypothetical protein